MQLLSGVTRSLLNKHSGYESCTEVRAPGQRGSTRRARAARRACRHPEHDAAICGGRHVQGDSFIIAFHTAQDAVCFCVE